MKYNLPIKIEHGGETYDIITSENKTSGPDVRLTSSKTGAATQISQPMPPNQVSRLGEGDFGGGEFFLRVIVTDKPLAEKLFKAKVIYITGRDGKTTWASPHNVPIVQFSKIVVDPGGIDPNDTRPKPISEIVACLQHIQSTMGDVEVTMGALGLHKQVRGVRTVKMGHYTDAEGVSHPTVMLDQTDDIINHQEQVEFV
jgi:hypothetical protein